MAYRSGFMMASMGIAYAGVDGTILEVNPAFASMLGYSADQRHKLIGRTLFSLSTPQDMQVASTCFFLPLFLYFRWGVSTCDGRGALRGAMACAAACARRSRATRLAGGG